ncbi:MAG: phenylalanine--tRNA ligase subunit beta [Puniceicoccales bacterium]|jgi:phenylalanyl-tRNA synthetase beta chain|nr:phenylalanine--tRNA ligase subunit beta [Puniceicoccales bacterium]
MKVSLQWLNRYVDLSDHTATEIADALPMLGLEVEGTAEAGLPPLPNVVVGEILSFTQHPNADKLSVCQVNTGDAAPRQIVCGAKNFKAGDRVPVALPGAALPGGFEIKVSKLRDVDSHGMMCSARELGLGDDHGGLLILTDRNLPVGTPINDHFPKPDTVFEISVTANRGDALSHIGVARDLAAYYGKTLKLPELAGTSTSASTDAGGANGAGGAGGEPLVNVAVSSPVCPYYTARSIRGVKIARSPEWLRRDLEAVGLRPVNNVVDATNWVMLETGQPLHAFDAAKIAGRTLHIRDAAAGETLLLLDGKTAALEAGDCVIADAEKPLVVAGIMGGEDCGVSDATADIVLESAWFDPSAVRKTSRRLGVATDSSQRFTRDADPEMADFASRRAAEIILQTAGGSLTGAPVVVGRPPRAANTIAISGAFVRTRLGCDDAAASDDAIASVFRRLGFGVAADPALPANWLVTVPTFRPDVGRPIDLVEEFVRVHGAACVPADAIVAPSAPAADAPVAVFTRNAASLLAGRGYAECWHYTLIDGRTAARFHGEDFAAALALANPLASDQSHVRPSLLPGLLGALRLNLAGRNAPRRLFEIGRVFRPARDGSLRELISVAFVILSEPATPVWKKRDDADFFTAKKLALELAALAGVAPRRLVWAGGSGAFWQGGHAGAAKDRAGQAEIVCGLADAALAREWDIKTGVVAGEVLLTRENFAAAPKRARFQDWSPFPPASRDVAVVVDAALPAADVLDKIRGAATKAAGKDFALENVVCFDVYSGAGLPEGKKSLAFSITFRAVAKTLTDDEVNKALEQILAAIEKTAGYQVRR